MAKKERYNVEEAADYLGLDKKSVYTARSKGLLPSLDCECGNGFIFTKESLDHYKKHVQGPQRRRRSLFG